MLTYWHSFFLKKLYEHNKVYVNTVLCQENFLLRKFMPITILSRKHMLIRFIMFMFIMVHSKMGHNDHCKEHFPNAFCVVPINKILLLSNALNLRLRGSQRLLQILYEKPDTPMILYYIRFINSCSEKNWDHFHIRMAIPRQTRCSKMRTKPLRLKQQKPNIIHRIIRWGLWKHSTFSFLLTFPLN